jgi:hypothetical protein
VECATDGVISSGLIRYPVFHVTDRPMIHMIDIFLAITEERSSIFLIDGVNFLFIGNTENILMLANIKALYLVHLFIIDAIG